MNGRSPSWRIAWIYRSPPCLRGCNGGQLQGRQVPYGTRYFWLIQANEHALEQLQAKRTAAQTRRQDLP
jgi:hypothetical protein